MFNTFSQQMSRIAVVGFYTDLVLDNCKGLSQVKARIVSASLYVLRLIYNIIKRFTVDRAGRGIFMTIGTAQSRTRR